MHEYLAALQSGEGQSDTGSIDPKQRELYVGDVIQAAINKDLRVESVLFPNDAYLDIGTPDHLVKAVHSFG
jgi:glucose-1-phosphate thymidylyltransferase